VNAQTPFTPMFTWPGMGVATTLNSQATIRIQ
jgi:hypothetical protein